MYRVRKSLEKKGGLPPAVPLVPPGLLPHRCPRTFLEMGLCLFRVVPIIEPQDIINHLIDDMDGAAIDVKDHIVVI